MSGKKLTAAQQGIVNLMQNGLNARIVLAERLNGKNSCYLSWTSSGGICHRRPLLPATFARLCESGLLVELKRAGNFVAYVLAEKPHA